MTEIIAEVASNHGGERVWMERFIEAAAGAGADYVKFQSYQVKHLALHDPQYQWLGQSELSNTDHERLLKICQKYGIKFLTTVFHEDRVPFLASLGLKAIKIGSGEASNKKLLHAVAKHPWKVYVSTGLTTQADLEQINIILAHAQVTLLHAVSEYPTRTDHVNLGRMHWLEQHCFRPVGYSDHTVGAAAGIAAISLSAAVVETHLSSPTAPRCQEWDKTASELAYLVNFRDTVAQMKKPGRMAWSPTEVRPFVGRWHVN